MKHSVIKDIFNGHRGHETMNMPKEILDRLDNLVDIYNQLKEKLSPELVGELRKYADETTHYSCEQNDFYFVEGFKLGLLVGMESVE